MPRSLQLAFPGLAVAAVLGLLLAGGAADAQPSVPATFYGTVVIDGESVPDGTEVRAFIDGQDCTQDGRFYRGTAVIDGVSQYSIEVMHESQHEGCGVDGAEVSFTIGGEPARQSATWRAGPRRLDLNAGAGEPAGLPTPAPAPTQDPAGAAATATAGAIYTPITGETPPIDDDVGLDELPGVSQRIGPDTSDATDAAAQEDEEAGAAEEDNDNGIALWLIGVIIALILIGIVVGWIVAGRRHLS